MQKYGAEFFGTFWLVLGGCGSAVLADTDLPGFQSKKCVGYHRVHRYLLVILRLFRLRLPGCGCLSLHYWEQASG